MKNSPRILFMGSPDFAAVALRSLAEKFNVVGVVTQPDRRAGRGKKMVSPPVKLIADELGIKGVDGNFTQINNLLASDIAVADYFGISVSISGDYAIVGAGASDYNSSLINTGSSYIFKKGVDGNFTQINKLLASDAANSDQFGASVSISGDYAIVGAYGNDDSESNSGSAYIFKKGADGNFTQINKILSISPTNSGKLGTSVAIDGNNSLIGASGEQQAGTATGAAYFNTN